MSVISLKVIIVDLNTTKTIQFSGHMSISEACRDIRDKLGDKTSGPNDHGIFYPLVMKWLTPNKTLDFYDLRSGDTIEYKKKHRPLRIKLMDETVKTVLIDDSLMVSELVELICKRIGIANFEEYSLLFNEMGSNSQLNLNQGGGGVLKRKNQQTKDNTQMTHEDGRWLNPDKGLAEQGIAESDILLLKKKFFFSDQNIDRNDPIQLNLVYVQSRDAIVSGKHPCTQEEAVQLAALQCQVQFGNHEPDKHKPGFIKLKDFVSPDYQKEKKDLEKKIFNEHRKLQGLNELNAKFRYVQLCRSLKTYGVTFFEVKEKVPKKNKLIPRLLGVTRDSIMKLDAETKEIMKVWPLTTLRRWAPSPNSFTLDFGDYADAYYSVQTTEGDQISQLIAGYIDIIMKKRKEAARVVEDDEEQVAVSEENIRPAKASAIHVQNSRKGQAMEVNIASASMMGDDESKVGAKSISKKKNIVQAVDYGFVGEEAEESQQIVLQNINNGFASVNATASELNMVAQFPTLGNDPAAQQWRMQTMDANRQAIASQIGAHLAAAASALQLTANPGDLASIDFQTLSANISTLSANLSQIASNTKVLAGLMDGMQGDKIMEVARQLAAATAKMLASLQPIVAGEAADPQRARVENIQAAQELSKVAYQFLFKIGEAEVTPQQQQELIEAAKQVAQATSALIGQGLKPVSNECKGMPELQEELFELGKASMIAADGLVASAIIAAPSINMAVCQDGVLNGALSVKDQIALILEAVDPVKQRIGSDAKLMVDLNKHAQKLNEAILKLINKAKGAGEAESEVDKQYELVLGNVDQMLGATLDSQAIVNGAKGLTLATTQLVNLLKSRAQNEQNPEEKDRILAAARALAEATSKMVGIAKDTARNPNDQTKQETLKCAIQDIKDAVHQSAGDQLRRKALQKLGNAAKQTAASTTQLISSSKVIAPSNRNQASQMKLNQSNKKVADQLGGLVSATKNYLKEPEDTGVQLKLIAAAKQILQPSEELVSVAKNAAATTGDQAAQTQILSNIQQVEDDIGKLQQALQQAEEATAGIEFDSALQIVHNVAQELQSNAPFTPNYDQSAETCQNEINNQNKALQFALGQLLSASAQGNEKFTGSAAREVSAAYQTLATAMRGLGVFQNDPDFQNHLLQSAAILAQNLSQLIASAKNSVDAFAANDQNGFQQEQEALQNLQKQVQGNLVDILDLLPGHRDVEQASQAVLVALDLFENGPQIQPAAGESFQMAQNRLNAATLSLGVGTNTLINAARNVSPTDLKSGSNQIEDAFNKLIMASQSLVALTPAEDQKREVGGKVKEVAMSTLKLLQQSKIAFTDPSGQHARNQLNLASQMIAAAISQLQEACTTSAPGLPDCNKAEQILIAANGTLDAVNDPAAFKETYFDCLKISGDQTAQATQKVLQIMNSSRTKDPSKIGSSILDLAQSILGLSDVTAKAAYLIGLSDPSSVSAQPGVIDAQQISQYVQDIQSACQKLVQPKNNQQQVLSAASIIAKNTAALCAASKQASQNPNTSAMAKQEFVQYAKNIAGQTAALVQVIKALAGQLNDANRQACQASAQPLISMIDSFLEYASKPEFQSTPAQISPMAQQKQQPLLESNRGVIQLAQDVVGTAKSLCSGRMDPMAIQLIQTQSKGLSDGLKSVHQQIKQNAPGQRECEEAVEKLNICLAELDGALVQSELGSPKKGIHESSTKDSLINNVKALVSLVQMIQTNDPSEFGAVILQFANNFQPTTSTAITLSSAVEDVQQRKIILESVKNAAEQAVAFLYTCKDADSANPETFQTSKAQLEGSIRQAIEHLEGSGQGASEINHLIEEVQKSLEATKLDDNELSLLNAEGITYQFLANRIFQQGKNFVNLSGDAVTKSTKPSLEVILPLAEKMAESYRNMNENTHKATLLTSDKKNQENLKLAAKELGACTTKLIEALKSALSSSSSGAVDSNNRQKVSHAAREVSQSVGKLIQTFKEGSKGLVACEQALNALQDMMVDLESQLIFIQAGQLDPLDQREQFQQYKDLIENNCRTLVLQSKALVSSAASANQQDLANSCQQCVDQMTTVLENVKKGATAITSNDRNMQEEMINCCKKVTQNLIELISSAQEASGKPMIVSATGTIQGNNLLPEIMNLKDTAKAMVGQIGEMIKLVKLIGDESQKPARTVEGSIKEIERALEELQNPQIPANGTAVPEEVANLAKTLASCSARLVPIASKGVTAQNQDEFIKSVTEVKKGILDLLRTGKSSTENAPEEAKASMVQSCTAVGETGNHLLTLIQNLLVAPNNDYKNELQVAAKNIALAVNSVVEAAGQLIPGGYVDPNDPNVIAERELLSAAASIEAAAKKLAMLKPAERPREANENLNFEEQIVEAAKAIAAATGALIKSATFAQREIVAKGKLDKKDPNQMYFSDGTWNDGLVSAAKSVAAATGDLCEAANAAVKGEVSRERVIAASRAVSSSTTQLLTAAQVKADPNSQAQVRLKAAGKSVTQATEKLVKAAEDSIAFDETESVSNIMKENTGSLALQRAKELEAQTKVLQMEKELEMARMRLAGVRKGKYAK